MKKAVIIIASLGIAVLFLVFAAYAYPVPAGDSQFFIVPAVQFAHHGTLISPLFPSLWEMNLLIDPSGMSRFLFYPPLFPLVVSFLMPVASPQGAFIALAILNISVLILSALLFYKIVSRKGKLLWQKVLVIVLAFFALAASLAETGRPEVLGRLFVVLTGLTFFYIPRKYVWLCYGVLAGFMLATHPPAIPLLLLVIGILMGMRFRLKDIAV